MTILKNFAKKQNGYYEENDVKNVFSHIGRMIYQPKKAKFIIGGSKISINIDEVGGAIPTAEPFRIMLHLNKACGNSLEIYPASFMEKIFQKIFSFKNLKVKNKYVFKGNEKLTELLAKEKSFLTQLQKQNIYIRIPKENTSKIILTPPHGIENELQLAAFIDILKTIEAKIKAENDSRNY
ncbi:hypothetical protein O4H26_06345 [Aequorivita viscosa]|nr:hypothetical protein [Aequorivita viscosa]